MRRAALLLVFAALLAIALPTVIIAESGVGMPPPSVVSGSVTKIVGLGPAVEPLTDGWRIRIPGMHQLATPAVADGRVFIGGGFGSYEFYAFDALTGEQHWAIRVSDDGPTTAVVENGLVGFNTESCTLFVVRAATGDPVWSRWLGDPLMSQPTIANDRIFMVYPTPATHVLAAFDLQDGTPLWQAPVDTDAITAPIAVGGDLYLASQAGTLYRFEAGAGRLVWSRPERLTSAPFVVGEQVFASMHDESSDDAGPVEGLGYLNEADGTRGLDAGRSWSRSDAPWLSGEVQRRSAYGGSNAEADDGVGFKPGMATVKTPKQWEDGEYDPMDNNVSGSGAPSQARIDFAEDNIGQGSVSGLWEYQGSRPLVTNGLVIATVGHTVRAVDMVTGAERWAVPLGGDIATSGGHLGTPPALAGGWIYLATTAGDLLALDPLTGAELWRYHLGMAVRAQPAVVDGRVYVGTTTGDLVMIDSHHRDPGDWPMWGGSAQHQ